MVRVASSIVRRGCGPCQSASQRTLACSTGQSLGPSPGSHQQVSCSAKARAQAACPLGPQETVGRRGVVGWWRLGGTGAGMHSFYAKQIQLAKTCSIRTSIVPLRSPAQEFVLGLSQKNGEWDFWPNPFGAIWGLVRSNVLPRGAACSLTYTVPGPTAPFTATVAQRFLAFTGCQDDQKWTENTWQTRCLRSPVGSRGWLRKRVFAPLLALFLSQSSKKGFWDVWGVNQLGLTTGLKKKHGPGSILEETALTDLKRIRTPFWGAPDKSKMGSQGM